MTDEYLTRSGCEFFREGNLEGPAYAGLPGSWVLPPWDHERGEFSREAPTHAGFAGWEPEGWAVLDRQYMYDPKRFLDLSGRDWKVYRRNVRKWERRSGGALDYRRLNGREHWETIEQMLISFSYGRTVYDSEVMVSFFLYGNERWGLFRDGTLVGLNVVDENTRHRVYRYCLDNGEPFLNEYLRHRFYVREAEADHGKLVNDGGDLDSEGLARFKQRLNPAQVLLVYTNRKEAS